MNMLQVSSMDSKKCPSTDHLVALNAADGTRSQELAYSFQNGMHTFSIPIKVDEPLTVKPFSTNKDISHNQPPKVADTNSLDYHLVKAVSFELASTGISRDGKSISQEYTLVPTGGKPFGTEHKAVEEQSGQALTDANLQNAVTGHSELERKRAINDKNTSVGGKRRKVHPDKSISESVTELGDLYKKSRKLTVERSKSNLTSHNNSYPISTGSGRGEPTKKDFLLLSCEWSQCSREFNDLSLFMKHVSDHINEVTLTGGQKNLLHGIQGLPKQIRNRLRGRYADLSLQDVDIIDEDEEEENLLSGDGVSGHFDDERYYCCLWRNCGYASPLKDEIVRHINFHTFHTKLKYHGSSIWKDTGIEPCNIGTHQRNVIPELSEPLVCQWEGCTNSKRTHQSSNNDETCTNENGKSSEENHLVTFSEPLKFYWHVAWHSEEMRDASMRKKTMSGKTETDNDGFSSKQKISCKWKDCTSKVGTVSKLKDHLRVHSQERFVACPVCGGLFTNRSKFYDHCKRQAPESSQHFKCSYCNKKFATERLLRDHMRAHVNHYKCPLCEMTCPKPSGLAQHMAYRHFQVKSFGCDYEGCLYRAKTNADLRNHMRTHLPEDSPDAFFYCEEDSCSFKAKSKATVRQHKIDKHTIPNETDDVLKENSSKYVCHMCNNSFARGAYLTQHFLRIHKFRWPSGHSRFRYKKDERTGHFHLQTIRFESVELHNNQVEQQTEEDEFVLVDEDTDINENDEDDRSSGESLSGANNDENNTEDGYLTFGNIFSDKPDTKNAKPEDNVGKMSKIETHIGGGGGGLDAIIAAASVLDGK